MLIVGAGVAGALMAWRLAGAGARVTVVEAGPHVDRGAALQRFERSAVRVPEAPYAMAPYAESSAIATSGKMDRIRFAALICGRSAGPRGIGSARRSVFCLPTWNCKAATVSAPTGPCATRILQHGTT